MRRLIILGFLLFVLLVLITGCNKSTGSAVFDKNISDDKEVVDTKIETISINCEDDNICTDDVFNEKTKKCDYIIKKNCCGNGICEDNEGCNSLTMITSCKKDCGLKCEPKMELLGTGCEGLCSVTGNTFIFTGIGKAKFQLMNLGEKKMNELTASLKCKQKSGSTTYISYFQGNKEKLALEPKAKAYYYIEFKQPDTFNLECDLIFKSDYSVSFNTITLTGR